MNNTVFAHCEEKTTFKISKPDGADRPTLIAESHGGYVALFASREQLAMISKTITDYLISLEPDEPVARVIANHLMDEANKIVGEDSDAN